MKEIEIPYHLAIPAIVGLCSLIIILFNFKHLVKNNKRKWFWISIIAFLIFYSIIVGSALYEDLYCQWDLNRYDLNKDGFFGGKEITAFQEAAMERMINDVGRNFSFITGTIFLFTISPAIYFCGLALDKMLNLIQLEKTSNNKLPQQNSRGFTARLFHKQTRFRSKGHDIDPLS